MKDILHKFYDKVEDELDVLSRKESLSATELENGKNAVCALEKILKIESIIDGTDNSSSYGRYSPMSYGMNNPSYGRNRNSMGQYSSSGMRTPRYTMNASYGGDHKTRLISKLEKMAMNAENDYEAKEINEFISHVENDYN